MSVPETAISAAHSATCAPVSVVVPCYRCIDTIRHAVASVMTQRLRPAETILIDDGSGDGTLDVLHSLAAEHPPGWIKVLAQPQNAGPSSARNRGWGVASQEYIAFLDADDSWHPRKLELQIEALRTDPRIALLAHSMDVRMPSSPLRPLRLPQQVKIIAPRRLLLNNPFPTASVVLRRDLPFRFDENRRRVEDFLLWAQIVFGGHRAAKLDQVLASWHKPPFGAGGLTADLKAMDLAGDEVRDELYKQGLISRAELYLSHTVGAVRRMRRHILARRHHVAGMVSAQQTGRAP